MSALTVIIASILIAYSPLLILISTDVRDLINTSLIVPLVVLTITAVFLVSFSFVFFY